MAEAAGHFSILNAAIRSGKVTVLPTAVGEPVKNPQTLPPLLPAFDLRTLAESDTHVMFAVSISREVLAANVTLIAGLMNAATGL